MLKSIGIEAMCRLSSATKLSIELTPDTRLQQDLCDA